MPIHHTQWNSACQASFKTCWFPANLPFWLLNSRAGGLPGLLGSRNFVCWAFMELEVPRTCSSPSPHFSGKLGGWLPTGLGLQGIGQANILHTKKDPPPSPYYGTKSKSCDFSWNRKFYYHSALKQTHMSKIQSVYQEYG